MNKSNVCFDNEIHLDELNQGRKNANQLSFQGFTRKPKKGRRTMTLYRITFQAQNGTLHTHVVLTDTQLARVKRAARRLKCTPCIEKLTFTPSHVTKN